MILLNIYIDWARDHCRALGFTDEARAAEQFRLWFDVLGEFDLADLREATRVILRSTDPITLMGQRAAILKAIHASREARLGRLPSGQTRADVLAAELGVCNLCGNSGMLSVPHPAHVREGRWCPSGGRYHTVSVACRCPVGWRVLGRLKAMDKAPYTLDDYEQRVCPDWRGELRQRRREEQAERYGQDEGGPLHPWQVDLRDYLARKRREAGL